MTLGRLIPILIALSGVADIGLRFVPTEYFTFRAWEGLSRYPSSLGPCTPNARYESHDAHGDLPNLANRPDLAVLHTEIFTTDRFGCRRNGEGPADQTPRLLMLGDSFGMGSGVSDEETLTAQLEKILHRPVYNSGNMKLSMWRINSLLDGLKMTQGIVLYEYVEVRELILPAQAAEVEMSVWEQRHRSLQRCWDGFWGVNPLRILCQRRYRRIQDDRWLPNLKRDEVAIRPLKNGRQALFLPYDIDSYGRSRLIDLQGVLMLQDNLKRRGLTMIMVLVPDKFPVYAALLQQTPPPPETPYLDELEKALKAKQVPVINLRKYLCQRAIEELPHDQYLYLQDDSHWNARGIEVSAREIVRQLKGMGTLPASVN